MLSILASLTELEEIFLDVQYFVVPTVEMIVYVVYAKVQSTVNSP